MTERKLLEIRASKKKIFIYIAMRMPLLALAILAFIAAASEVDNPNYVASVVIIGLVLIFVLSPIRHIGKVLIYYDYKIVLGKKQICFDNPLEVQWTRRKGYITGNRLVIYKRGQKESIIDFIFSKNDIDVTYMTEPKEQFIRCYMNHVSIKNKI